MAEGIYKLLEQGGPWGIIALLSAALVWAVRDTLKQRDEKKELIEMQYNELFEMLEKKIAAEVEYKKAFDDLRDLVRDLLKKLNP